MAKMVRIDLVVKDDRAADLVEAIRTVLQFAKMDGDVPDHEIGDVAVRSVSSKVMAGLTTSQREDLEI